MCGEFKFGAYVLSGFKVCGCKFGVHMCPRFLLFCGFVLNSSLVDVWSLDAMLVDVCLVGSHSVGLRFLDSCLVD